MTEETLTTFFEKNFKNSMQETITQSVTDVFDSCFNNSFKKAFDNSFEKAFNNSFEKAFDKAVTTKLNPRFEAIEERLTLLEHSVAVIEHEHGSKIQILLDCVTGIIEKQDEMTNSINYLKSKDYDHDVRIAVLEELSGYPYYSKYKK